MIHFTGVVNYVDKMQAGFVQFDDLPTDESGQGCFFKNSPNPTAGYIPRKLGERVAGHAVPFGEGYRIIEMARA